MEEFDNSTTEERIPNEWLDIGIKSSLNEKATNTDMDDLDIEDLLLEK